MGWPLPFRPGPCFDASMRTAEEYRAEARRLREVAEVASTTAALRTALLEMAETYDTLSRQVRELPKE